MEEIKITTTNGKARLLKDIIESTLKGKADVELIHSKWQDENLPIGEQDAKCEVVIRRNADIKHVSEGWFELGRVWGELCAGVMSHEDTFMRTCLN